MKKLTTAAAVVILFAAWAAASPSSTSLDGWISDSKCAAKGANAGHAQCTKKCIEGGEKPVLVTDKDQKVLAIDNPSAVSGHEGQHVRVAGTLTANGSLHIDKVTPTGGN